MPEEQESRLQRWSAKRKTEVVLRLLRGEELEEVSRELLFNSIRRGRPPLPYATSPIE